MPWTCHAVDVSCLDTGKPSEVALDFQLILDARRP